MATHHMATHHPRVRVEEQLCCTAAVAHIEDGCRIFVAKPALLLQTGRLDAITISRPHPIHVRHLAVSCSWHHSDTKTSRPQPARTKQLRHLVQRYIQRPIIAANFLPSSIHLQPSIPAGSQHMNYKLGAVHKRQQTNRPPHLIHLQQFVQQVAAPYSHTR
jgi:hypothetical protein